MSDKVIIVGTIDHPEGKIAALLAAIAEQPVILAATDLAAHGSATTFMRAKLVDGEVQCEVISEEDFYGWPIEMLSREEMRERYSIKSEEDFRREYLQEWPIPEPPSPKPDYHIRQSYEAGRVVRRAEPFIPRIERTHPTSPRKSGK